MENNGKKYYDLAGVSRRHKEFKPSDSTSEVWNGYYGIAKGVVNDGGLCVMLGTRGSGKTQAGACCIGHACYNLNKTAKMVKAFDIFLDVRSDGNEKESLRKYTQPHLLVIDAFEVRGDTAFENRVMNHILDKRYDTLKPTVLITNDTPKAFAEFVGDSIIDRIKDAGGVVWFKTESFRGVK